MIKIGNKEELSKEIGNEIAEVVLNNPKAKLLLPTGSSPISVYKQVIKKFEEGISFEGVTTFNLDEYLEIDPNEYKDSFRNFMNKNLFDHININKENTYFPEIPESYDSKLDAVKEFDFGMIGVGTNGHIAFNEPPAEYSKRTNVVKLAKSTIEANFPGEDSYPTTAITMGLIDIIERPKKLVLIAWGESKRDALYAYQKSKETGQVDPNWPITYLIKAKNLVIYTDIELN